MHASSRNILVANSTLVIKAKVRYIIIRGHIRACVLAIDLRFVTCRGFLHSVLDLNSFFFEGTYTLSRKIVRNRDVSSYRMYVCKKKKTSVLSGV